MLYWSNARLMLFRRLRPQLSDMKREDAHGSVIRVELEEKEEAVYSRAARLKEGKIEESMYYHYKRVNPHIFYNL